MTKFYTFWLALFVFCINQAVYAQCPATFSCSDCQGFSPLQYEYCANVLTPTYYWVGETPSNPKGDFNAPCNWRIGSRAGKIPCQPPSSGNDVVFETQAFASATVASVAISITSSANCKNYTWVSNASSFAISNLTITMSGTASQAFDVCGSMTLIPQAFFGTARFNFDYAGTLNFRTNKNGIETITSAGQIFKTNTFNLIGGANTEFLLADDFVANTTVFLLSGKWNTAAKNVKMSVFTSNNGDTTRGLDIRNSYIEILGASSMGANQKGSANWFVDFYLPSVVSGISTANISSFQAAGSYIKFVNPSSGLMGGNGSGIQYETVEAPNTISDTDPNNYSFFGIAAYRYSPGKQIWIKRLVLTADQNQILNGSDVVADIVVLKGNTSLTMNNFIGNPSLITDDIQTIGADCQNLIKIYGMDGQNRIIKKSQGTLNLQYAILSMTNADASLYPWLDTHFGSGARVHNATSTKDAGGNQNWTIISKLPCAGGLDRSNGMYFHNQVDAAVSPAKTNFWHDAQNWYHCTNCPSASPTFTPAGRIPNAWDDVFFDNLSFSIITGTHASRVVLTKVAYCNDFRVLNTIVAPQPAGVILPVVATSATGNLGISQLAQYQDLNVFGDFLLSEYDNSLIGQYNQPSKLQILSGFTYSLWGRDDDALGASKDTIFTGFARITAELKVWGWYELYKDSRISKLNGIAGSKIEMRNCTLKVNNLLLSQRILVDTKVEFNPANYAFVDNGQFNWLDSYKGNTSFEIVSSSKNSISAPHYFPALSTSTYTFLGYFNYTFTVAGGSTKSWAFACNVPNLLLNRAYNGLVGTYFGKQDVIIHGNAILNENANFVGIQAAGNTYAQVSVLSHANDPLPVAERLVGQGDLTLAAGKDYVFSDQHTGVAPNLSGLYVEGNLYSVGTCINAVTLRTTQQNNLIPIKVLGTSTVIFTYINRFDNTGNPTINASNSINGFNGASNYLNWNFTGTTGTTYYWRRHATTNNTRGFWSDPCHWTTTQSKLVGDCACLPTINDIVIFDASSGINANDSCKIDGIAQCKELHIQHKDVGIYNPASTSGLSSGRLNIYNTLSITSSALVNFKYDGVITFNGVGAGALRTAGTYFKNVGFNFSNPTGAWDFLDALTVDYLSLNAGTVRTNGYKLNVKYSLTSNTGNRRILDLGTSTVQLDALDLGTGGIYPLNIAGSNITVLGASSTIISTNTGTLINGRQYCFGANNPAINSFAAYNIVSITLGNSSNPTTYPNAIFANTISSAPAATSIGNIVFNKIFLNGNIGLALGGSAIKDSLYLVGGKKYVFAAGQILNFQSGYPGGKIFRDNTSNFIDFEPYGSGTAYFRKVWGEEICLDYIKVRNIHTFSDSIASPIANPASTTVTNPTFNPVAATPAQTIASQQNLRFYTGVNCDNILGTATGIWAFSLTFSSTTISVPTQIQCSQGNVISISCPILGDDMNNYKIYYTWTGINNPAAMGAQTSTVASVTDPDQNGNTPFNYTITMMANYTGTITVYVAAERCGLTTSYAVATGYVYLNDKNILLSNTSSGACVLNNQNFFVDILDQTNRQPMAAILDNTGAGDASNLGQIGVTTTIGSVGSINAANHGGLGQRPIMGRRWQITPTNNVTSGSGKAARVRLYFTRQELDALIPYTNNGWINATTEIEVWKYPDNQYDMVSPTVISHTVRTVTSNNWATNVGGYPADNGFLNTTDIICIEFDVTSFSHFVIVPTMKSILNSDLLGFNARADQSKRQVRLNWEVENNQQKLKYVVERSPNGVDFMPVLEQTATAENGKISYQNTDFSPLQGGSYYRLRIFYRSGSETLSDIRQVSLEGTNILNLYPVPASANTDLNIDISTSQAGEIRLSVMDMIGRTILETSQMAGQGAQTLQMPLRQLASGTYKLKIMDNTGRVVQKTFLVQ